ncbi:MAG: uroporphyrinogen-III synthase [Pyrinomonadaceae bacterium]
MSLEILVIRAEDGFSSILIEQGFLVANLPLIVAEAVEDLSELESCLKDIENFDGIFITSANAARVVSRKLREMRKDFSGKFFILGGKSNEIIKNHKFEIFFKEQAATAEEMLALIPEIEISGKHFLYPCGDKSLRVIPETLKDKANVREVVVYKTLAISIDEKRLNKIKNKLEKGEFAAVCFFSPSGAESFLKQFGAELLHQTIIATIGKTTAEFFEQRNLKVDFISPKASAEDFAVELIKYLREET